MLSRSLQSRPQQPATRHPAPSAGWKPGTRNTEARRGLELLTTNVATRCHVLSRVTCHAAQEPGPCREINCPDYAPAPS